MCVYVCVVSVYVCMCVYVYVCVVCVCVHVFLIPIITPMLICEATPCAYCCINWYVMEVQIQLSHDHDQ